MELHTCLWHEVDAFSFSEETLNVIRDQCPQVQLKVHHSEASFLREASTVERLLTWEFHPDWYQHCPKLTDILTPAAGTDWVSPDPLERVRIIHGTFHGPILAESLLSAIFFMNHQMPAMLKNFTAKQWNRNLQTRSRLLAEQTVFIIGYGSIGRYAAALIKATGANVVGVTRTGTQTSPDIEVIAEQGLNQRLPEADHVVLLLPGNSTTDRYMSPERILACKPGVYLYNFGRGNALHSRDLVACKDHLGGAFLDVTDEEPLPPNSPLWTQPNIMITPHSSCVYENYQSMFLTQVINHLTGKPS